MRDMKFISSTETSSLIEGYKRDSVNDAWRPFRMHVSNGVMVEVIEEFEKDLMEENKQNATANAGQKNEASAAPKRRGRPSKAKLAFNQLKGVDGEFTVKDVVEKNDIREYEVHNLIRSAVQSGKVQIVKELIGGRGKPRKVYRLA
jgi:predicted transcriptional regulator